MNLQRVLWIVLWSAMALIVVGGLALLIPGSPVYLPGFFDADGTYMKSRRVNELVQVLDNPDEDTRVQAMHQLSGMGSDGEKAIPRLTRILLEDKDRRDRIEAALALKNIITDLAAEGHQDKVPDLQATVSALARALSDEDGFVRMDAAIALLSLKKEAQPAVPALIAALKDRTNQTNLNKFLHTIQEEIALALGRASAGTSEAVPALMEALEAARDDKTKIADQQQAAIHGYELFRAKIAFARALGEIGPEARPAVPLLEDAAKKDHYPPDDFRVAAKEAIQKINGK
jgi:HEAT repeat protein